MLLKKTIAELEKALESGAHPKLARSSRSEKLAWIGTFIAEAGYADLNRDERGVVRAYIQAVTGYSRAQMTRYIGAMAPKTVRVAVSEVIRTEMPQFGRFYGIVGLTSLMLLAIVVTIPRFAPTSRPLAFLNAEHSIPASDVTSAMPRSIVVTTQPADAQGGHVLFAMQEIADDAPVSSEREVVAAATLSDLRLRVESRRAQRLQELLSPIGGRNEQLVVSPGGAASSLFDALGTGLEGQVLTVKNGRIVWAHPNFSGTGRRPLPEGGDTNTSSGEPARRGGGGGGNATSGTSTTNTTTTITQTIDSDEWTDATGITYLTDLTQNVGIGTITPSVKLDVVGTISGTALTISSLVDCNTIDTDADGNFVCGTDEGGVGASAEVGTASFTGAVIRIADSRYVNIAGDTMTGALVIDLQGLTTGIGLEVVETISGSTIFANRGLSTSGSLVWEGAASGASLYIGGSLQGVGLTDCDASTQTLNWDATTGRFSCGTDADTDTTYTAGQNLALNGSVFSLNSTITGALVRFNTVSGSTIYAQSTLASSGSLAVDGTAYLNSATPLKLTNAGFFGCTALETDADGDIVCGSDADTNTTYSAGQGITLNSTAFSLSSSISGALLEFQTVSGSTVYASQSLRSSGSLVWEGAASGASLYIGSSLQGVGLTDCDIAGTSKLLWDSTTGRFSCGTDANTGTTYTAGQNLALNGNVFSLNTTITGSLLEFQTVSGSTVFASSLLRSSGALVTESGAYIDGTTFVVQAGNNRVGIGTATPSAALHVLQENGEVRFDTGDADTFRLSFYEGGSERSYILNDQVAASFDIASDNRIVLQSTDYVYVTGTNYVAIQSAMTVTTNNVGIGTSGPDSPLEVIGTASGTTVYASNALRSSGSLVWEGAASGASLYVASSLQGVGLTDCDIAGTSKLLWDSTTGRFSCGTDANTGTTYTAGQGLGLNGSVFSLNSTITGALVRFNTVSGSTIYAQSTLASSGSLAVDGTAYLNAAAPLKLTNAGFFGCTALETDADGDIVCGSDGGGTSYTAGQNLTLNGTAFSLNTTITGALLEFTTVSGSTIFANTSLRSSGSLTWEGAASGASLYIGGSLQGAGLTDCDADSQALAWDATTGRFLCGDDDSAASGLGVNEGDIRYVNIDGDTMTGTLVIDLQNLTSGIALEVIETISGSTIFANNGLSTSGSLVWEGAASGASLYIGGSLQGAGLADCDLASQTLNWDATTGRFSCGTDADTDTTYTAGQGLALNGANAFSLNTTITGALLEFTTVSGTTVFANTSLRSSGSLTWEGAASGASLYIGGSLQGAGLADCDLASQTLNWDATTGRFSCGTDADTDTTYTAGQNLALNGTAFSLNSTITGALVRFNTVSGSTIYAKELLASSGSLAVDGTAYLNAAAPLKLTNAGFFGCTALETDADGDIVCGSDADTNTTYTAGQGLALNGANAFSLNTTITGALVEFQTVSGTTVFANTSLRSSGSLTWEGAASGASLYIGGSLQGAGLADCDLSSQTLNWDATTGRFSCGTDADTDTTYTAGQNLALNGTAFSLNTTITGALLEFQTVSGSTIFANTSLRSSGSLTWEGAASGASLYIGGSLQGAGLADCDLSSQTLNWDSTTGRFSCGTDADTDTTYTAGQGLALNGANAFSLNTTITGALLEFTTVSGTTVFANTSLRSSGSLSIEGRTYLSAGSFTTPSLTFQNDTTSGLFSSGNGMNVIVSGTNRWGFVDTTFYDVTGANGPMLLSGTPSATAPSFTFVNDPHTGMYSGSNDIISFTAGGTDRARIDTTGIEVLGTASGMIVHAQDLLRSSGALAIDGTAYFNASAPLKLTDAGFFGCTALETDADGDIVCGSDGGGTTYTAGQGLGLNGTTLSLNATITGSLLEFQTVSGSTVYASRALRSSGALITEGNAYIGNSAFLVDATSGQVSVGALTYGEKFQVDGDARISTTMYIGTGGAGTDTTISHGSIDAYNYGLGMGDLLKLNPSGGNVSINKTTGKAALDVLGTVSGTTVYASNTLRSSGALAIDGTAYFNASAPLKLTDAGFFGCTALETDADGDIVCGSDGGGTAYTAGQGLSLNGSNAFSLNTTITGALLEFQTVSGSTVFANNVLRSSGSLVTESGAYIDGTTFVVQAGNNRVGIGTSTPDTALDVIGTISGSTVYVTDSITGPNSMIDIGGHIQPTISGFFTLGTVTNEWYQLYSNWGVFSSGLGIGTEMSSSQAKLEVAGTASGRVLFANDSLRSSGSLVWEGAASGATLYLGGSLQGVGLTDCDADNQTLAWDATTGRFSCGDDDTGGSSVSAGQGLSLDGTVLTLNGTISGSLLEFQTVSGSTVYASKVLRSSGALTWEGAASGATLYIGGTSSLLGQVTIGDGSYTSPGLKFSGATTGMFRGTDGRIEFVVGGITALQMYGDRTMMMRGAANLPGIAWGDGTTTGLFGPTTSTVGIAIAANEVARFNATGLNVISTVSGSTLYAANFLRSSGSVVWEGTASGNTLVVSRVASHLIPSADETWDLGTSANRWRDLYLSGGTLHMGTAGDEATIKFDGANNRLAFDTNGDGVSEMRIDATSGLSFVGNGTLSGKTLFATTSLRSSGSVTWEGVASGAALYVGGTVEGAGLGDCDAGATSKLLWDATTKRFSCGTDQGGGSGLSQTSGDERYVNQSGDTMTGALTIDRQDNGLVGLEVNEMMSGTSLRVTGTGVFVAGDPGYIPLTVIGAPSQSDNLLEFKDSSLALLASVASDGAFTTKGDFLTINSDLANANPTINFGANGSTYGLFYNVSSSEFEFNAQLQIGGALQASTDVVADSNITLNADNSGVDAVLTFGSDGTAETITFENSTDFFNVSDDVNITGGLTVIGAVRLENYDGCTALETDADGDLVCGTDDSGSISIINIGGAGAQTYNFLSSGATPSEGSINGSNDFFIEGEFEVDGTVRFDNSQITLSSFSNGGSGCSSLETNTSGNLVCGTDDTGTAGWGSDYFTITDGGTTETIDETNSITFSDGTDINVSVGMTDTVTIAFTNASGYYKSGDSVSFGSVAASSLSVSGLSSCNTIDTDGGGNFTCGTDETDLAEAYPTLDPTLGSGEVLALDESNPVFVKRATGAPNERVIGVYSTKPWKTLGKTKFPDNIKAPVALTGRVPVNFSLENGSVAIGDAVSASSVEAGSAKRANEGDATIGYALDNFDETSTGTLLIFVDLDPAKSATMLVMNTDATNANDTVMSVSSDVNGNDDPIFRIDAGGSTYIDGSYNSAGADYAEWFFSSGVAPVPGEVVCIDVSRSNTVKRCDRDGDDNVMGIVSTNPAFIGNVISGAEGLPVPGAVLVGLIGQVPAKVIVENDEPIRPGDSLTAASIPGYARKARAGESTVGVALEPFDSTEGEGLINVLISRRNQSLTVSAVEEEILAQIQAMEIEDEVEIMVAQAMGDLNVDQSIIDEVARQVDALNVQTAVELEVERQIDLLRAELAASSGTGETVTVATGTSSVLPSDLVASTLQLTASLSVDGDARIVGDLHLDGALVTSDLFVPGVLAVDGSLTASTMDVTGDADVYGTLTLHGPLVMGSGASLQFGSGLTLADLIVERSLAVLGDITVDGFASFLGDVAIEGELTVSRQAGHITVPAGGTGATFAFTPPFKGTPVVTASPNKPVLYAVSIATSTGFTVSLAGPAESAVTFSWVALIIPNDRATLDDAPSDGGLVFPVDDRGVPVSSSLQWNACIRGIPLFDATGIPYSCDRYHDGNTWEHPDLHFTFVWNDALTPPYMQLPEGYVSTVTENSASVRAAILEVNGIQEPQDEPVETEEEPVEQPATATGDVIIDEEPAVGTGEVVMEDPIVVEPTEPVAEEPVEESVADEPVIEEAVVEPIVEEPVIEEAIVPEGETVEVITE